MKVSEQVENILKYVPATRSSDKELFITYMQKFGVNLTPEQIALFREMPSLETLRRSRQAIQEQGKYQASVQVEAERKVKQVYMKRGGFKQPETILEKNVQEIFFDSSEPEPVKKFVRQPLPWNES